ncbi:hypothetical protein RB594_003575 [Gaeumannomyces avenae]
MEQQYSTSKVTVEFFDPHDVYKLLAPGLVPLLPLRNLHWKSHSGPPRSIDTLHVELVPAGAGPKAPSVLTPVDSPNPKPTFDSAIHNGADGFQTQAISGGAGGSADNAASRGGGARGRRHQIPGLRRTPYLKLLLIRCDDNDTYKSQTRSEIREWVKQNTSSSKKTSHAENHDAFEWLIVHVVIPNTVAATQPRVTGKGDSASEAKVTSRWRGSTSTLLEKMLADFNGSPKGAVDRVAQIRIGINDVPYDLLPRVVPAVPTGYSETAQDIENAWADLIAKMKAWILSSFDMRVSQYEEDIKEKDAQRVLPGWNFCTFFILKEGLARGFESVGLVDDALVGYDELSVGLDTIIQDQALSGLAEAHGGTLLGYTEELSRIAHRGLATIESGADDEYALEDENPVDLQSGNPNASGDALAASPLAPHPDDGHDVDIPITVSKKPYRELILANNVSVFDFRCYIFARQIALLFRLGNATATREELLAKTREQQQSLLHGVAPRTPHIGSNKPANEAENLSMLAEVCRRTLEFIPSVSQVMRRDILACLADPKRPGGVGAAAESPDGARLPPKVLEIVDNMISSFAFSVAHQILAQTSTKALPIPESTLAVSDDPEPKTQIPEPKTTMHPARTSSHHASPGARPPPSPGLFPGPGQPSDPASSQFLKVGLEDLAARRAELYTLSRNILKDCGKKRGWTDGWDSVPLVGEPDINKMEEVDLDDDKPEDGKDGEASESTATALEDTSSHSLAGVGNRLLRTALDQKDDFYRLYETLTLKALRHYAVASYTHSVKANTVDMAVLKYHLQEFGEATSHFVNAIPFFAERGWSLLELSMLVMYSTCLKELEKRQDYVKVVLKLLSKAAMAEHDRQKQNKSARRASTLSFLDTAAIKGFLPDVMQTTKDMAQDIPVPLRDFFFDIGVDGPPRYVEGQDSFSLSLTLYSLLVDDLQLDDAMIRMTSLSPGGTKEIWLASRGPITLKPGRNKIELHSNISVPGTYEVDQVKLRCNRVLLHHERPHNTLEPDFLSNTKVVIFQTAKALDVQLSAAKHIQLDTTNCLEVSLSTGWNHVASCDLRVRAATGGLRLLTAEAKLSEPTDDGAMKSFGPPDGGLFHLGALGKDASVRLQFPYTVEQELPTVAVRIEVSYCTEEGGPTFEFVKTPSVDIALALGVNVQDVFKHNALFSRFTVSTASSSPLRLFASELIESDLFAPDFGGVSPPTDNTHHGGGDSDAIVVFPRQPASLLYKISRKPGSKVTGPKTRKTMYLKLHYSVAQEEIESTIQASLAEAFKTGTDTGDTDSLQPYSRLAVSTALTHVRSGSISAYEMERAVMLGSVSTSFLAGVLWEQEFSALASHGIGNGGHALELAQFMRTWQERHPQLSLIVPKPNTTQLRSISIPVDVPSITIVHTADIQLDRRADPATGVPGHAGKANVAVNQLMPAILRLKWSRIWDTGDPDTDIPGPPAAEDLEFTYEVTAPQDTWLLGGRRKGNFVIPGVSDPHDTAATDAYAEGVLSTAQTEADIPLLLVPLREGWLAYPSVEIREVRGGLSGIEGSETSPVVTQHRRQMTVDTIDRAVHCETDYKNLGETIHVVTSRQKVTLSLDASGPGGGPLVLESKC